MKDRRQNGVARPNGKHRSHDSKVKTGVSVTVLRKSIQQRLHRAAVFEAVASKAVDMFVGEAGQAPPYAISDGDGLLEVALPEVVHELALNLQLAAAEELAALNRLLALDLGLVGREDCPVLAEAEDDDAEEIHALAQWVTNRGLSRYRDGRPDLPGGGGGDADGDEEEGEAGGQDDGQAQQLQ